jgi:hypothetical protein
MVQFADDEYECFTCKRRFRTSVFSIVREWNRVDYSGELPSVEITESYGLECYCSQTCLNLRLVIVMASEGVPIRRPGLGPVESCAKCRALVDMEEFHLTYLESYEVHETNFIVRTVDVDYLAVLCRECRPMQSDERSSPSSADMEMNKKASTFQAKSRRV